MKNNYLTIILILATTITYAQGFDVRKLTLKSDVILLYDQDSIAYLEDVISDHTTINYYQLKAVAKEVKNNTGFKFANAKLRNLIENEDYFKIVEKGDCMGIGKGPYDGVKRKYYGMLFLQKKGKDYEAIGTVQNDNPLVSWEDLIKEIQSVSALEKIKNLPERYTKTIDWFLANNVLPDENFVRFYKQKAFLKQIQPNLPNSNWPEQKHYFSTATKPF